MILTSYPLLDAFWTILEVVVFALWIWLVISIFVDIFRSHDLSGFAKALWVLGILIVPLLGVLIYLIARGGEMHERVLRAAQVQNEAIRQQLGGLGATSVSEELSRLADLRDRGVLSPEEFEAAKAKVLGANPTRSG
jgi:hypothetical protein